MRRSAQIIELTEKQIFEYLYKTNTTATKCNVDEYSAIVHQDVDIDICLDIMNIYKDLWSIEFSIENNETIFKFKTIK